MAGSPDIGTRRLARETALQVLCAMDVQPDLSADQALARFFAHFADDGAAAPADGLSASDLTDIRARAERLVEGVAGKLPEIDALIGAASRNWRLARMARVDRNLLRLAVYEMKFGGDIHPKAAINEAIEIAKRYGASETPAFVNGILDRVLGGRGGA